MRLREAAVPRTASELAAGSPSDGRSLEQVLADLVGAELAQHDLRTGQYTYSATGDDRHAVDAVAVLYSQWPDTLPMLFYNEPPKPLKSFSRAFRLRIEKDE